MEHFQPDPKKLEQREKFVDEITARQNHLYLRARFVQGSQKERKQKTQ